MRAAEEFHRQIDGLEQPPNGLTDGWIVLYDEDDSFVIYDNSPPRSLRFPISWAAPTYKDWTNRGNAVLAETARVASRIVLPGK